VRIAVLDEDPVQLQHTIDVLTRHCVIDNRHVDCIPFAREDALRRVLRRETFDLLVLDAQLPHVGGDDLVSWLRRDRGSQVPILMLSFRNSELDVASALDRGVDDYVCKPFRPIELAGRCRRLLTKAIAQAGGGIERMGDWSFDHRDLTITFCGRGAESEVHTLTDREFRLALSLFRRAGRPISRNHLLESAGWPVEGGTTRVLDNHVYRIRQKLDLQARGVVLQAVYGQGYRLSVLAVCEGRDGRSDGDSKASVAPGTSATFATDDGAVDGPDFAAAALAAEFGFGCRVGAESGFLSLR